MPLLQVVGVSKEYKRGDNVVQALQDVSLCVQKGEMVAIIGQSGSGKSTLMNMIGCLDYPTTGQCFLGGAAVGAMSANRLAQIRNQQIGFVFQGFNLIPCLDAIENVELPLIYRGLPKSQRRALATQALQRVGLSDRLHHRPAHLSGGQQQRVAIARALAACPPIILADEPTGNLDAASSGLVMDMLTQLWQEGHTVIIITHDSQIAAATQRQVLLENGRIAGDKWH